MARSEHTKKHVETIEALLERYPGAEAIGLPKRVRELWGELGCDEDECPPVTFVPDAFFFDRDASELLLFEVEVTHHVDDHKLARLGYFWSHWDAESTHVWLRDGVCRLCDR